MRYDTLSIIYHHKHSKLNNMQANKNINLKRDPPRKWEILYMGYVRGT